MSLKKPSEYFKIKEEFNSVDESIQSLVNEPELNTFSDAFESFKKNLSKIEILSEFSGTLDNYRVNIERINYLSEKIDGVKEEIQTLLTKEDLDRAMMAQLLVVEQSILDVQEKVKGINENNLNEIRSDVFTLTESVNTFLDIEVPKYRKLIVESELRSDHRYKELEENVNQTLDGIEEFVDKKYDELTETLQGINEKSLSGIIEEFKSLDNDVLELKEQDIPKYKGFIVETERKVENKLNEIDSSISIVLEKVNSVEVLSSKKIGEVENLQQKINDELQNVEEHKKQLDKKLVDLEVEILRNETHIKNQNEYIENIQEQVLDTISKLEIEKLEEQNYELGKKVKYLEEVFEKFNQETLTEGLLNEPPEVKNSDPLTPLDQNFVTLDQLQQHYKLFINRIQQQLSTLGGGGETRLKYLDDIVGIATNPSAYDNKFLKYNHGIGKFEFVTVTGGGGGPAESYWVQGAVGIHTLSSVGIGTTNPTSDLTVVGNANVTGIVTATDFNSASDINLKENISKIDSPLDTIAKLEGVNFQWKDTGKKSIGVIAQEVEKVLPELVSTVGAASPLYVSKTVNYNGIIGLLIECVKEQQREIEYLKKHLDK